MALRGTGLKIPSMPKCTHPLPRLLDTETARPLSIALHAGT
jgi:hypothetical protein